MVQTIEIYTLVVLQARSLKSRCHQGWCLLRALRESSCLSSRFQFWPAILSIPWLVDTSLQSLPLSSHSILPVYLSPLIGHQSFWVEAHPIPVLTSSFLLSWLYLQRPYFQVRAHLQLQGLGCQHIFWIQPTVMGLSNFSFCCSLVYFISVIHRTFDYIVTKFNT